MVRDLVFFIDIQFICFYVIFLFFFTVNRRDMIIYSI